MIQRVMTQYSKRDISEDDIFKKPSSHTGLPFDYFKNRLTEILEVSDKIAAEMGLERDRVEYYQDAIENIIYSTVFIWPSTPDLITERQNISQLIALHIVRIFENEDVPDPKNNLISLDEIFDELLEIPELSRLDTELLAFGLIEVWNYLLDQGLII